MSTSCLERPSWGRELTYETIPISVANPNPSYIRRCLVFYPCVGGSRGKHANFFFITHEGGTSQLDILDRPSWRCEQTCKTIPPP